MVNFHPVDQHVGKRIRMRRNILGFSQDDLGKYCGVAAQQIQKYETGKNRVGSSRLFEISSFLKVPMDFFFDGVQTLTISNNNIGLAEEEATYESGNIYDSKESVTLLKHYYKIEDPAIRQKVLSIIKNLAV